MKKEEIAKIDSTKDVSCGYKYFKLLDLKFVKIDDAAKICFTDKCNSIDVSHYG